jgi:hypothetical protein
MVRKLQITVRGREKQWGFMFDGDTRHLADWRADGLEVDEIINTIPEWVVDTGLLRVWCFMQDLLFGFMWRESIKPRIINCFRRGHRSTSDDGEAPNA